MKGLTSEDIVGFKKTLVRAGFLNSYKNLVKYVSIILSDREGKSRFYFSIMLRSIRARIGWLNF